MAREWSRRSIEELVRAYMRRHTPKSSGDGAGDGVDFMKLNAEVTDLYDANGHSLGLPLAKIEIVLSKNGAPPPDDMRSIKFSNVPPIYFKNQYNEHYWVLGIFAGYGRGFSYGAALMDLFDKAGGLVATVQAFELSYATNPFSPLKMPTKLEITKEYKDGWSKFPGSFFGNNNINYTIIHAASKNATNPLPEGWHERVAFYKARSPYN